MDGNSDSIEFAIDITNQFRNAGLELCFVDDNYEITTDDDIMFFSLYEALCFIQGYEFVKVSNNE